MGKRTSQPIYQMSLDKLKKLRDEFQAKGITVCFEDYLKQFLKEEDTKKLKFKKFLGLSTVTLNERISNPEKFTTEEILVMSSEIFKQPVSAIMDIIMYTIVVQRISQLEPNSGASPPVEKNHTVASQPVGKILIFAI